MDTPIFAAQKMMKTFAMGAVFLAAGITATAQVMTQDTLDLQEVKVQGNRQPVRFSENLRNISLFPSQELRDMPALTVQDILAFVSSVDIRQRGAGGVQADVSMRGGTFDQVLILINGVKFTDPQTGHHLLNLPINPMDIERIEVLRGAASRIFGQNAFGGAINIITKSTNTNAVAAEAIYGEFNTRQVRLSSTNTSTDKRFGSRVSISTNRSDGYEANRDFTINQGMWEARYQLNEHNQLKLLTGFQSKAFGAQNFYTPPAWGFQEYEETEAVFATLSGRFTRLKNLTVNLNWREHNDEFRLNRNVLASGVNLHKTRVLSADFNMFHESKLGISSVGGEFRMEGIESSNLGDRNRNIAGFYAEHQFNKWNRFNAVIGTNVSYIEGYGWTAFPGIDLGYRIYRRIQLYGSVGRSYRVPTFTDLYYTDGGPSSLGNPNLDPEAAWTYEGGIKWTRHRIHIQADYFQRDASTLIDWQKELPTDPWMAVNTGNATTRGLEFMAQYRPHLNFIQSLRIGYTYVDVSSIESPNLSRYVYDYLRHQFNAGIQLKYTKQLTHSIYYRYMERVGYPTAHVLDTRLNYHFKAFDCFLQVDNISNTLYRNSAYVNMPLSWTKLGLRFGL